MKSKLVAYILWFFLGFLSLHRFYLGKIGSGILYLITGQLFGLGWLFDAFLLGGMVDTYNLKQGLFNSTNISQNVVVNVSNITQPERFNTNLEDESNQYSNMFSKDLV